MSFAQKELTKLNGVISTFTDEERVKYKEETDYIQSLLQLLEKQEEEVKTATTKGEKDKAKKEEEKTKEKVKSELTQLVNAYSLKKLGNVTHKVVPDDVIEGAKLTKASHIYNTSGEEQTKAYLKQQGLDNWEIDPLSSKQILVLKDGNKIKLAARGTDAQGKNINDMEYDVAAHFGKEQQHNILVDGREQVKAVKAKYPNATIEGHGFSLGSNVIIQLGKEHGFPTESYNGYITKNIVNDANKYTGNEHNIWRTTDDLPSIRSTFLDGVGDFKVRTVPVLENSMNPYKAHKLENFTTNNRSGKESSLQVKLREAAELSSRHGELQLLNKVIHDTKNRKPVTEIEEEEVDTLIDNRRPTARPKRVRIPVKETGTAHLQNKGIDSSIMTEMKRFDNEARSYGEPHLPRPEMSSASGSGTGTGTGVSTELRDLRLQFPENFSIDEFNQNAKEALDAVPANEENKLRQRIRKTRVDYQRKVSLENPQLEMQDLSKPLPKPKVSVTAKPFEPLAEPIRFADVTPKPKAKTSIAEELELGGTDLIGGRGFVNKLRNNKTLSAKDKTSLLTKRQKVDLPDGNPIKSRTLSKQMDTLENKLTSTTPDVDAQLQDVLDFASRLSPPRSRPDKSFTEWAKENGVSQTDHKKSIWELAGNELTPEEKVGYKKSLPYNSEDELNEFMNSDDAGKGELLTDAFKSQNHSINEVDNLLDTPVRGDNVSRLGNVSREVFRGIHPMSLGVGMASGFAASAAINWLDPSGVQPEAVRVGETGILAGAGSSFLTGAPLLPEIAAGGVGYLAGTYTQKGVTSGLEYLGVGKDASEGIGATIGGGVGGAAAVGAGGLVASLLGGAATGAEEGAVAGGGIFSAETAAIGAGVGALIGLGSYAWGKLHG